DNVALVGACIQGCHSSPGLKAKTDKFNVNIDCENICKNFQTDDLKSACYGGCTHIPSLSIDNKCSTKGIFNHPLFSSGGGKTAEKIIPTPAVVDDEQPLIRETHIRIFIPDGPSFGQNMIDEEGMRMMMNFMHGSKPDNLPDGVIRMGPSAPDNSMGVPSFARNFCFRARAALHHLATHPLFMASIILMFVSSIILLIFACYRLNVRRARRATFQRQYRRMPAFFKSPTMRVNPMTPQPPQYDDDEALILPTKEPIIFSVIQFRPCLSLPQLFFCRYKMANSQYTYVRGFEAEVPCLPNTWIVVRLDGQNFHAFTERHCFAKPNDERALRLACASARSVMRRHGDIILAYGQSDEFSFVFRRSTDSFNRRPR
ncbi:unnamed protein product, partial [Hymenolepis diminuta]|uniref:Probable tRNA(His) guanylyltransferase n=1 Tax=Hymenolepis diminuta TaxID=6216 RepID=A0A0R3SS98_HYMDI